LQRCSRDCVRENQSVLRSVRREGNAPRFLAVKDVLGEGRRRRATPWLEAVPITNRGPFKLRFVVELPSVEARTTRRQLEFDLNRVGAVASRSTRASVATPRSTASSLAASQLLSSTLSHSRVGAAMPASGNAPPTLTVTMGRNCSASRPLTPGNQI